MNIRQTILILGSLTALIGVPAAGVAAALWWMGGVSGMDLGQPRVERAAQMRLPRSNDPVWATLRRTAILEDRAAGAFKARYPATVRALAGRELTVRGYLLPLDANGASTHFILSKYTPVCPFCPPGQPNEVIEVRSISPIIPGDEQITLTGRFSLQNSAEAGLFFHLDEAVVD